MTTEEILAEAEYKTHILAEFAQLNKRITVTNILIITTQLILILPPLFRSFLQ